jgi:hypothetical protein
VLSGGLVRQLGELADQLLEHRAHLRVAHHLGVQVDVRELLGHQVEQPGLVEPVDLRVEVEALEDVAHRRRERLDVLAQVLADVVLVAHQLLQVERRRVVEVLPDFLSRNGSGFKPALSALEDARSSSTATLVGSSTQSRRRSTVNGRMTLPYSDCL